jgi:hypothetical protein
MIIDDIFEKIKEKHGKYASWAVWMNEREGYDPESFNIDDLSIFNKENNPQLLQELNPNIVMVGLNFGGSSGIIDAEQLKNDPDFKNFHNVGKGCWDFKLRYAIRNTELYGAYLTDIVKYYSASYAKGAVINNQQKNKESKEIFLDELKDLGCKNPIIIAMGGKTYKKLTELFGSVKYNIIPITHYSFAGKYPITGLTSSKENYRDIVMDQYKNKNKKEWENYWDRYKFKN